MRSQVAQPEGLGGQTARESLERPISMCGETWEPIGDAIDRVLVAAAIGVTGAVDSRRRAPGRHGAFVLVIVAGGRMAARAPARGVVIREGDAASDWERDKGPSARPGKFHFGEIVSIWLCSEEEWSLSLSGNADGSAAARICPNGQILEHPAIKPV